MFLVEGLRHVARAIEEGAAVERLFYSRSALSNRFGRKLVERHGRSRIELSQNLYRALTLAVDPQGIGAVVRQRWQRLESLPLASDALLLVVESVESPGNLGTMLRTAEAAGVSAVILVGEQADPYDPAAVRASVGAVFAVPLVRAGIREFTDWAKARGVAVAGSSPSGLLEYRALRCRWPMALLLGSEKLGLSPALLEACDYTVRIPMFGRGESVNVAVAAGVLLYEMFHQRRERD
ncbi:MAG: RNA methyltransferase [Bryobacteraceae bacterium]